MVDLDILDLSVTPARPHDRRQGLLAFIAFSIAGLRIDGVTLRRTRTGDISLSFPTRKNGDGQARQLVRPLTSKIRDALMQRVLKELRMRESDAQTDGPSREAGS